MSTGRSTIPGNLAKSTVFLNVPGNNYIDMSQTFFSKFLKLRYWAVDNCELHRQFNFPNKLTSIKVGHNKLSFQEFRLMLSNLSREPRQITAKDNNMKIETRTSIIKNARSIRELYFGENVMVMTIKYIEDRALYVLGKLT